MSCLFDSLSYFLKDYTSPSLRLLISNYLLTDPVLIDNKKFSYLLKSSTETENLSVQEYANKMKR